MTLLLLIAQTPRMITALRRVARPRRRSRSRGRTRFGHPASPSIRPTKCEGREVLSREIDFIDDPRLVRTVDRDEDRYRWARSPGGAEIIVGVALSSTERAALEHCRVYRPAQHDRSKILARAIISMNGFSKPSIATGIRPSRPGGISSSMNCPHPGG